jgi:hypothetical protein
LLQRLHKNQQTEKKIKNKKIKNKKKSRTQNHPRSPNQNSSWTQKFTSLFIRFTQRNCSQNPSEKSTQMIKELGFLLTHKENEYSTVWVSKKSPKKTHFRRCRCRPWPTSVGVLPSGGRPAKNFPPLSFSLPSPIFSLTFSHLPLLWLSWLLLEKRKMQKQEEEEEEEEEERNGRKEK